MVSPYDRRRLWEEKRVKILNKYDNYCVYCGDDAEEVDHVLPWSLNHDDSEDNLVASCFWCNRFASNKVFNTFQEKRQYLVECKYRKLKKKAVSIWLVDDLDTLGYNLRSKVSSESIVMISKDEALRVKLKLEEQGYSVRLSFSYRVPKKKYNKRISEILYKRECEYNGKAKKEKRRGWRTREAKRRAA